MIDLGLKTRCDEKRVVVHRLLTAIEPHEGSHRRAVGKAHHVAWYEAERVDVPAYAGSEIRRL